MAGACDSLHRCENILAAREDYDHEARECMRKPLASVNAGRLCVYGTAGLAPTAVLWGDSHAAALVPAVAIAAEGAGRAVLFAGNTGCPPLVGITVRSHGRRSTDCLAYNAAVLSQVLANPAIDTVILAARWAVASEATRYGYESDDLFVIADEQAPEVAPTTNRAVFRRALDRTLEALRGAGKRVVIVGPVPEIGMDVPKALAIAPTGEGQIESAPTTAAFLERQSFVLASFRDAAAASGSGLILPHEALCDAERCDVEREGRILYSDDDHISYAGIAVVQPLFAGLFSATGAGTASQ